jgi:Co/Zn/Cd efflux system component
MSECCDHHDLTNAVQSHKQTTILRIVLAINALMFVTIAIAALYSRSNALFAESLDNLGDAFTYGISLYAVSRGAVVKAKVAFVKGGLIFMGALIVLAQVVSRIFMPQVPVFEIMGIFSILALFANSGCFYLLLRHRHDDLNMSSVWECSRNDVASNLAVFLAAGVVWLSGSAWPDMAVALVLVWFLLRSAIRIIRSAEKQLKTASE